MSLDPSTADIEDLINAIISIGQRVDNLEEFAKEFAKYVTNTLLNAFNQMVQRTLTENLRSIPYIGWLLGLGIDIGFGAFNTATSAFFSGVW